MILSVVTGTYNRFPSLKQMIESVRRDMIRGIEYEIIVVDGGSTDETLEWCGSQPDIRVIEHGELRGAIAAFCDGARAAVGQYVVMANDDIVFYPDGLLAAISHLERHPTCGGVAFSDNRTSSLTGNGTEYRVEGMGATTFDGRRTMVHYAQVGMFRKEVGAHVGWWGDTDRIMGNARTYGGDNYLSARIWELGLSIDAVPQCKVQDNIVRDALRDSNGPSGNNDSKCFYDRFPTVNLPPTFKSVETKDRLRILYAPIYEWTHPQRMNKERGMFEALSKYGLVLEWDYLNDKRNLPSLIEAWQPDILLTQIQGVGPMMTPSMLANARVKCPSMIVINWNGDAHESGLVYKNVLNLLKYVDIQTTINAKILSVYETLGIKAAYWQIGYKDPVGELPNMPTYDVLFQGNCYDARRTDLTQVLKSLSYKVGVYGNCQGSDGNTHYSFAAQHVLYAKATINVGDTYPGTEGFVSNRFFQCLAAGGFLLQQHSPNFDAINGTRAGRDYIDWTTTDDLVGKIHHWMAPAQADERRNIALRGQSFVRRNFSYDAQVRKLFTQILPLMEKHNVTP